MDVPESSSQGRSVGRGRGRPRGPRHRSSPPILIPRPTPVAAAENRRRRMQLNRASQHRRSLTHQSNQESSSSLQAPNLTVIHNRTIFQSLQLGGPQHSCQHCGALFWYEERVRRDRHTSNPTYNLCCKGGKILLPPYQPPPQPLYSLLTSQSGALTSHFFDHIRQYNTMFAMTSMGAKVIDSINDGGGPYVFKVSGQVCHRVGSLIPSQGHRPEYAQLYIYDTEQEISHRINVVSSSRNSNAASSSRTSNAASSSRSHFHANEDIVRSLIEMLNEHNPIVRLFRTARERLSPDSPDQFRIRLFGNPDAHGDIYSAPIASEVVGLVVGDIGSTDVGRDIIIEGRSSGLQQINEKHCKFMSMQYPLLFPYGENGYHDNLMYRPSSRARTIHRQKFKYNTKVHKLESRGANIPKFSFDLCPFDKLPEKNIPSRPLIDIIGVINYVGPFDYASPTSQNKRRIIKVRNLDEETHEIRLWGQHGESFDETKVLEKSKEGIVVGIFAGLTEGEYFGTTYASSSSATEIYLDLDIPEVQNYRTSYQWETPTLKQQLPQVIHLSPIQAAGKLFNLAEISTMPDSSFQGGATYSTIAKITSVLASAKWYYKVCSRCDQGYNSNSDTPTCGCPMSHPKPMYKLPLTLTDNSGSLNAIAFSSIAENLVERDAVQASQNMKIDAGDHVVALNNAIGKTKLFNIGMKTGSPSKFPISHIIRKCFSIDDTDTLSIQPATESSQSKDLLSLTHSSNTSSESPTILSQGTSQDNTSPVSVAASCDTENIQTRNSGTKRKIDFTEHVTDKFQSNAKNKKAGNISGQAE